MNTLNLMGRIVRDPETRGSVTTITVATDRVKLHEGKTFKDPVGYQQMNGERAWSARGSPCPWPRGHDGPTAARVR